MKHQDHNINQRGARRIASGVSCLKLFCAVALTGLSLCCNAADTNKLIDGWLATQTNLITWRADFVQTRRLKTLAAPLTSTGSLQFAVTNRFRWEQREPSQVFVVRNAEAMWVVQPALKEATHLSSGGRMHREMRETMSLFDAGFPRSRAELESRFRLLSVVETDSSWQMTLQPARAAVRRLVKEIVIGVAAEDHAVRSVELVFGDGSSLRNDFTNAVMNPPMEDADFRWQPGADYKVKEGR